MNRGSGAALSTIICIDVHKGHPLPRLRESSFRGPIIWGISVQYAKMSYTDSGSSKGKGQDRSTQWSGWDWDIRGFWVSSRFNSHGEVEYKYEYPQSQQQPVGVATDNPSSQSYHEGNATTQGHSEDNFVSEYETSPNADPQYPTTLQNETIPRSQYPHSNSSAVGAQHLLTDSSPTTRTLNRGSSSPYDGLSHDMQNLDLRTAGPSTASQYGNNGT